MALACKIPPPPLSTRAADSEFSLRQRGDHVPLVVPKVVNSHLGIAIGALEPTVQIALIFQVCK